MTRTDEIITAVTQELRRWAAQVDGMDNVRAVNISVKLARGAAKPRAVICQIESETTFLSPTRQP
jgi:hypothetical protein